MSQAPYRRTITIADVAEAAGVSAMTVSKVLRGTGRISSTTSARVKQIADELGYVPNRLAGGLSSQMSPLIGIVIPSIGDQVYSGVLAGINEVLHGKGFTGFIGETFFDPQVELRLVHMMLSMKPAGFILTGGLCRLEATSRLLRQAGIPTVQLWDGDRPDLDATVGLSHRHAGHLAARSFLEAGLTHCAYIGAQLDRDLCAALRMEGYVETLRQGGATCHVLSDNDLPRTAETAFELTRRLLETGKLPDAIHYLNDAMAIGGLRFLLAAGVDVPGTLSVNGFNGTALPHALNTKLTTIEVPLMAMGRKAAERIIHPDLNARSGEHELDLMDIALVAGNTVRSTG